MAKEMAETEEFAALTMTDGVRPDYIDEESARGNDEVTMEDIALPRIDVLQALSPQIKKTDPAHIEGSEQGVLYNTITEELYGPSILFIPVYFRKEWIIWKDRKKGGGYFGSFPTEYAAERARRGLDNPDDYDANETHNHFILAVHPQQEAPGFLVEEAVLSMARSKLSASRTLNSMIKLRKGDRFSSIAQLSAIEKTNAQGQGYWSFKSSMKGYVSQALFDIAEQMYEAIKAGSRSVDYVDPESDPANNTMGEEF